MSEEPLLIVSTLLEFLYTGDYLVDPDEVKKHLSMSVLQFHVKMFGLGDKYDIKVLCDVAVNKYSNRITHFFQPVEYLSSIPAVFVSRATNNEDLKEAAVHVPFEKLKPTLRQNKPVRAQYDLLVNKYPEFAKRLLATLMT